MLDLDALQFDNQGLIPAIVQDNGSGKVLTLAYMNRESLEISLREKRTCFYSRSRQCLWRKGETSGNVQRVVSVTADCDRDALLIKVDKEGPACHTGADSCFTENIAGVHNQEAFSLNQLYQLIAGRQTQKVEGSYTSYLFDKGLDKILKKIGEESTEVVIAAKNPGSEELIFEIADLTYHLLVLMVQQKITPEEVRKELANRHVVDKKIKQERMR